MIWSLSDVWEGTRGAAYTTFESDFHFENVCYRLLARTTPGTQELSLSHGCWVHLQGQVSQTVLQSAVRKAMLRHPMLRVFPRVDTAGKLVWAEHSDDRTEQMSGEAVTTVQVCHLILNI